MRYESSDEAKVKGCLILIAIAVLVVIFVVGSYFESTYPEDIQGEVVDKEKVVHSQTHSGKDYFYVTYYTTYHVKVMKYADETTERFDVSASDYDSFSIGSKGDYHVTGVRAFGRNLTSISK